MKLTVLIILSLFLCINVAAKSLKNKQYPKNVNHYDPKQVYEGQNFHYPLKNAPTQPHKIETGSLKYNPSQEYKGLNFHYPYNHEKKYRLSKKRYQKALRMQQRKIDIEVRDLIDKYIQLQAQDEY